MRVVSGGQTGVDRAALDVALARGMPCGGWCPKGRVAEDGPLAPIYPLQETPSAEYAVRTEWNVIDSDGTLILCEGAPRGGTQFTIECARKHAKPLHVADLSGNAQDTLAAALAWLQKNHITTLNIAGPRESEQRGIYARASEWLRLFFQNVDAAASPQAANPDARR